MLGPELFKASLLGGRLLVVGLEVLHDVGFLQVVEGALTHVKQALETSLLVGCEARHIGCLAGAGSLLGKARDLGTRVGLQAGSRSQHVGQFVGGFLRARIHVAHSFGGSAQSRLYFAHRHDG